MDDKKDKLKRMDDTAELIGDDIDIAEYNFTIDDILMEFGVERQATEPEAEPEAPPVDNDARVTDAFREVGEAMRSDQERRRIEEAARYALPETEAKASDEGEASELTEQTDGEASQPKADPFNEVFDNENTKVHVFEQVTDETEPKKKRRKKDAVPQPEGERSRIEMRETTDMQKVFGKGLTDLFGHRGEDSKQRKRRQKSEKELERELFGGDAPVIPGSPDRTPADEQESISANEEAERLVSVVGRSRLRLLSAAMVTLILLMLSFAPRLGLEVPSFVSYLNFPYRFLLLNAVAQIVIMLLCFEVTVTGFRDLLMLRPNLESVMCFAGFASLAHVITVIVKPEWGGYLPFAPIVCVSHLLSAYYSYKLTLAKLKSCRTAAGMSKPYIVCREPALYEGADGLSKYRAAEPSFFTNQLQKPDVTRRVWAVAAPIVIVASVAFASVASFGRGDGAAFPWSLAAIAAAAAPFSLLLPFCLTFSKVARRLGMIGEAVAGWYAASAFGDTQDIVVTDTDIFPPGSVSITGLKVFGGYGVDKVMSYAASLISASGAGTARPFLDLLGDRQNLLHKVTAFKFYENGGISGEIEGSTVFAGTAAFMMRTGIRLPQEAGSVFVAINWEIAGIFALNYNASPAVESALKMLTRQNITPVFAVRDFNITPSMIEAKFKLSTDTVDFPKIEERLSLSDPDRLYFARPAAVLSREGLGHYAEAVVTSRNMRRATIICTVMTLASVVLGLLMMFYLAYSGAPQTATPSNLFLYNFLWWLPNLVAARWVNA